MRTFQETQYCQCVQVPEPQEDIISVGDIYLTKINCSTNNRAWSFGLYAFELDPVEPLDDAGPVARAVNATLSTQLTAILGTDSRFESVAAWRRHTQSSLAGFVNRQHSPGLRVGDQLPNDNAIFINLRQVAADARFNGAIFIGGQVDADAIGNDWDTTYFDTQIKAFTDILSPPFSAVGADEGSWRFVVLSKAFVPSNTPIGTPFDIVEATASPRVQTQRRRAQKVRGYTLLGT